jgi:hypothetical protein
MNSCESALQERFHEMHEQILHHTNQRLREAEEATQGSTALAMQLSWVAFETERAAAAKALQSHSSCDTNAQDVHVRRDKRLAVYAAFYGENSIDHASVLLLNTRNCATAAQEATRVHWNSERDRELLVSRDNYIAEEAALRCSSQGEEEIQQRALDQLVLMVAQRLRTQGQVQQQQPSRDTVALLRLDLEKQGDPSLFRASGALKNAAQKVCTAAEIRRSAEKAKELVRGEAACELR